MELRAAWLNSVGLEKFDFLRNVPWLSEVTAGGAPAHERSEPRKGIHMGQILAMSSRR